MKQLRLSLAAVVLLLAFTVPTFAGDMYGGYVQPPPQPQQIASAGDIYGGYVQPSPATVAGDMETGVTANETTATCSLTESALDLVQSVLSLF